MLFNRTFDRNYILILYLYFYIGKAFDIYVNGLLVRCVQEDESLLSNKDGALELVLTNNKIKKRKFLDSGYWKQNGVEGSVDMPRDDYSPVFLDATKRTFTNQKNKNVKLWEFGFQVITGRMGYKVVLRHYLRDRVGTAHRYTARDVTITIRAKESVNFSHFPLKFSENDMVLLATIREFMDRKYSMDIYKSFYNHLDQPLNDYEYSIINYYLNNNNNNNINNINNITDNITTDITYNNFQNSGTNKKKNVRILDSIDYDQNKRVKSA